MRGVRDWFAALDPDWRATVVGALAAPALFLTGIVLGQLEGNLLPWNCEGMSCLFFAVLVVYSGGLLLIWGVIAAITALTRARWPRSRFRTRLLQGLAIVSYAPSAWFVLAFVFDVA
ncbi:MAG: hypothetical protein R3343_00070 [Nitriliruptorales bacterium]|nr:hypothetical protein [Nitriliruptorales bacterium]